ncbi:uncharacterized protein B0H18DRAFT_878765, partial [Fomitopsis serialis]|uniref:uncharacterized protein n=1 Tax=Fomitopsis serialis TaxID=139415 RepID=UPI002008B411
ALEEAERSMEIDPEKSFHLNLGNDRPNVQQRIVRMKNSEDYSALDSIIEVPTDAAPSDIPKTLMFVNTRQMTQCVWHHLHDAIGFLHANRRQKVRQHVMEEFISSKICILVSTEATGMGADILDIQPVIQFGLAASCCWLQCASERITKA